MGALQRRQSQQKTTTQRRNGRRLREGEGAENGWKQNRRSREEKRTGEGKAKRTDRCETKSSRGLTIPVTM